VQQFPCLLHCWYHWQHPPVSSSGRIYVPPFLTLRSRFIMCPMFVRWKRLIARNVWQVFNSNHGISHYAACCIDALSRGSILGIKFS
jgi:hypothetical protein